MPVKTQAEALLEYLRVNRSITPMDALRELGIFRLAARVWDLRAAGHTITMSLESDGTKHWARYLLVQREQLALELDAPVSSPTP